MNKDKEMNALIIRNVTLDVFNAIINDMATGDKFNLIPKDIQLFRIYPNNGEILINQYNMILTSVSFPTCKKGKIPKEGIIYFSREKDEITIRIEEKERANPCKNLSP